MTSARAGAADTRVLRIATRRSALALAQARLVAALVEERLGQRAELVPLQTSGDRLKGPLAAVGGKGLFVKEVEEALLDGRAELAVHSAKDLPARLASGLALVAAPLRADPRDALVTHPAGGSLAGLRSGARVGTGSLRRGAQLLAARPDLEIVPLRGNVETRLRKLEAGLDAVVLACAGLERLGLAARIDERIDDAVLLPAVGQGTLAIEAREAGELATRLAALGDVEVGLALRAERAFLVALAGDCNVPLAAHARLRHGRIALRALLAEPSGARLLRAETEAPASDPERAGQEAAERIREQGGDAILEKLAEAAP